MTYTEGLRKAPQQRIAMDTPWAIRGPEESDIPFIYATWLNSNYTDTDFRRSVRKSVYFEAYKRIIDNILLSAKVSVACKSDTPSVIYGYLVTEGNVIHYSFVKDAFRSLGIAKSLYLHNFQQGQALECTHSTGSTKGFLNRNITFNPFILYKGI